MGITHHSNYIRIMEEARVDMLDRLGYGFEKMEAEGVVSPVMEVKCQYRKPTTFQDEIRVEIHLKAVSVFKFTYGYIGRKGDDIVFTGESTHCLTENGRPLKLRERYPKLFVTD
jgi:hypothetical protein